MLSILLSGSLLVGGIGASAAAEQVRKPEEQSFLERYTNVAQDVILQGLKLVGVRYRWGGNDEDSGLDCSGFVRLVFIYSARHYQTDEALYGNFTKQTGIKINRIEGKEDELLERIRNEGANSPADVFITVDASRLAKADELGLFAPGEVACSKPHPRPPAHRRWFSFSTRARVIVYNKLSAREGRAGRRLRRPGRPGAQGQGVHAARAATPTTCRWARR
jgi:hypothetical protein